MCEGASCQKGRGRHLFGLLVRECKNVALVVRDETQARRSALPPLAKRKNEDQSAKHLQSRNSTSGIPIFVCPMVVFEGTW
jgi:hypothetical protein